jgi:hypothetical protein
MRNQLGICIYILLLLFFLILILGCGVHSESTRHIGHFWLIEPAPGDCEDEEFGGMKIGRGKPNYSEKTYLNANLSTTNPT